VGDKTYQGVRHMSVEIRFATLADVPEILRVDAVAERGERRYDYIEPRDPRRNEPDRKGLPPRRQGRRLRRAWRFSDTRFWN